MALDKDETNYNGAKASCDAMRQYKSSTVVTGLGRFGLDDHAGIMQDSGLTKPYSSGMSTTGPCHVLNRSRVHKINGSSPVARSDANCEIQWIAWGTTKCMIAESAHWGRCDWG